MSLFKFCFRFFSIFKQKTGGDGVSYISFMSRYISIIIDTMILYVVLQIVPFTFKFFASLYAPTLEAIEKYRLGMALTDRENHEIVVYIITNYAMHIIELILMYFYCVCLWVKLGATPAKLCMGMRMLNKNTMRFMSFKQANRRFFSYIPSLLPLGLGVVWGALDKKNQMLHDRLAGTVVVPKVYSRERVDLFDRGCEMLGLFGSKLLRYVQFNTKKG